MAYIRVTVTVTHAPPSAHAARRTAARRVAARRGAGNLWGDEAARLARAIGARAVIPCHYEMFEFNTASPQAFVDECRKIGQGHRVLRCGGRWSSEELG